MGGRVVLLISLILVDCRECGGRQWTSRATEMDASLSDSVAVLLAVLNSFQMFMISSDTLTRISHFVPYFIGTV